MVRFHAAALLLTLLVLALAIDGNARAGAAADPRWLLGALALVLLIGLLEATSRRTLVSAALGDDHLLLRMLWTRRAVPLTSVLVAGHRRLRLGGSTVKVIELRVPAEATGRPETIHFVARTDRSEGLLTLAIARAVQPPPAHDPGSWARLPGSGQGLRRGRRISQAGF